MLSEKVKDYSNRVIQATKGELVVITYEYILELVDEAIVAKEKDDRTSFETALKKAQKALKSLTDSLDFKYHISRNLMSLYLYTNQQFVKAQVKFDAALLRASKKVLNILLTGWQEACDIEDDAPIIENAQKLYAGLTYGKGQLNETIMSNENIRGLKA